MRPVCPQAGLIEANGELKVFIDQNLSPGKGEMPRGALTGSPLSSKPPDCPPGPGCPPRPAGGLRWHVLWLHAQDRPQARHCPYASLAVPAEGWPARAGPGERLPAAGHGRAPGGWQLAGLPGSRPVLLVGPAFLDVLP
ncbi:hypothetical protein J0S82_003833 [Galemys pyrenaicus]|uniref:Uncharacterized protein n=1 Tax=Galemys pyrenaicus TaxID=202257 RepID=A0A8J6AMS1_GALPY|nr:hypothetical protein J0S82_003833 [Galemys pyrenaicus]